MVILFDVHIGSVIVPPLPHGYVWLVPICLQIYHTYVAVYPVGWFLIPTHAIYPTFPPVYLTFGLIDPVGYVVFTFTRLVAGLVRWCVILRFPTGLPHGRLFHTFYPTVYVPTFVTHSPLRLVGRYITVGLHTHYPFCPAHLYLRLLPRGLRWLLRFTAVYVLRFTLVYFCRLRLRLHFYIFVYFLDHGWFGYGWLILHTTVHAFTHTPLLLLRYHTPHMPYVTVPRLHCGWLVVTFGYLRLRLRYYGLVPHPLQFPTTRCYHYVTFPTVGWFLHHTHTLHTAFYTHISVGSHVQFGSTATTCPVVRTTVGRRCWFPVTHTHTTRFDFGWLFIYVC